jgi:hypothetical protein
MKDDFKDISRFSEKSLKEVWDNEEDNVWGISTLEQCSKNREEIIEK